METEKLHTETLSSRLYQTIEELKTECTNENLHTFRIQLKTIKAFCHLFEQPNNPPESYHELYAPFKKLFKNSGKLRDNYQLEKRLGHYFTEDEHAVDLMCRELKGERQKLKYKLLEKIKHFDKERTEPTFDFLSHHLENKKPQDQLNDFKSFTRHRMALVEEQLLSGPDKEQLHAIRAQLKNIFLLKKNLKVVSNHSKIIEQIDHIQEELGNLHDFELLYHFVDDRQKNRSSKEFANHAFSQRLQSLSTFIEKLRIDCLKKLTLLAKGL